MDNDEIIEVNKLIAIFMGWKCSNNKDCWTTENKSHVTGLAFHSSWDWLMPVVEKIEAIKDLYHGHFGVHIVSNTCTIQSINFRPDEMTAEPPYYFNCVTLNTKIESTYLMVIRFIKWYNKKTN